jgi:hypothetical protein
VSTDARNATTLRKKWLFSRHFHGIEDAAPTKAQEKLQLPEKMLFADADLYFGLAVGYQRGLAGVEHENGEPQTNPPVFTPLSFSGAHVFRNLSHP